MFLFVGFMKVTTSKEKLVPNLPWTEDFSEGTIKVIGALEIAGALGLILPMVTGIMPWLTPIAAVGLALTMVGAAVIHVRRGELLALPINLVILALALFVAYGRFMLVPVVA